MTAEAAVRDLRSAVEHVHLALQTAGVEQARAEVVAVLAQIDDYLLPRLKSVDAPVVVVVGGSTGAGKSTLVNALVGAPVTAAGVLRPTTRSPVLVHHPDDAVWFNDDRILPGLPRVTGPAEGRVLRLVADPHVPQSLALLDAPDIDSVVQENRELAAELLAAADLWLFVTTAARYADAVPWELLQEASRRSAAVAVVLDRVPSEAAQTVLGHLAGMLDDHGLGQSPVFVVPETSLEDGRLPDVVVQPIRSWLEGLAADDAARAAVVRRTLDGALHELTVRSPALAAAADDQRASADRLSSAAEHAYEVAAADVAAATSDGTLLRGEVLARWHDAVGSWEAFRTLEEAVGRWRDKAAARLRGRPPQPPAVEQSIGSSLHILIVGAADAAAAATWASWFADPSGRALLDDAVLSRSSDDLAARTASQIRQWQAFVLDLVSTEGADKRSTARAAALGVNGLGTALMVTTFAFTGGVTGAEVGIAGGTAAAAQAVLTAIFGDEAVRRLARRAHEDLDGRVAGLLQHELDRYTDRLGELDLHDGAAVRAASTALQAAMSTPEGSPR